MAVLETVGQQVKRTAEVLDGAYVDSTQSISVSSKSGISGVWTLPYDNIQASYPNSTTEVFASRVGVSVQQTVTVVYTDSTKAFISSVTRS